MYAARPVKGEKESEEEKRRGRGRERETGAMRERTSDQSRHAWLVQSESDTDVFFSRINRREHSREQIRGSERKRKKERQEKEGEREREERHLDETRF